MPRFRYVAMDSKGAETEGVLDAESKQQAVNMIRSKGFFPTRVAELDGGQAVAKAQVQGKTKGLSMEIALPAFLRARCKPKHLMVTTRQLATLVDAGLPLLRGLKILLKQEKLPVLREALTGMGESVESGSTFSEALAQYPRIFDKLFVNMVKAGEAGGILEVVLNRLAEFMEKAERIKNKVKSAMIYPTVVLVVAVVILAFLMTQVIPKFQVIFEELLDDDSAKLPALTEMVIAVSEAFQHHFVLIAIGGGIMVVGLKFLGKTKKGRFFYDLIKLKAPIFGSLFTKTAVARFSRTLGTLMTSGVPVLQALNIVKETSGNEVVSRAIMKVHDSVKEGDTMSMPLSASGVFPGMVVSMVDVGEETGALPEMLMKIADTYENEVDTAVEGLTSIIEPLMIVALALVVGTIVIAMFMPLIEIITQLTEGV